MYFWYFFSDMLKNYNKRNKNHSLGFLTDIVLFLSMTNYIH